MSHDAQRVEIAIQTHPDASLNSAEDKWSPAQLDLDASNQPGLHSLADGDPNERPPYSNFTLVKYAILGSPDQRLTLAEIYRAISNRFPWFQDAGNGWKGSVRHCLSLDTQFQKVPRPPTAPGKGSYWTVCLDTPRGNKRERKRGKRPSKRAQAAELKRIQANASVSYALTTPAFREYATVTVPSGSTIRKQPPTQSGWVPYFPTEAMVHASTASFSPGNHTGVSHGREESPITRASKTLSSTDYQDDSEGESEVDSDEDVSQ